MDIEKAKEYLYDLEYGLKLEQEENIKKCGYNPEQEIEAIETVLNELDNKDKIINEMGTTMAAICTGLATVREQFEKCYCEFINSDEDCCWKTDKSCKDCIIDYFTKKVSEK